MLIFLVILLWSCQQIPQSHQLNNSSALSKTQRPTVGRLSDNNNEIYKYRQYQIIFDKAGCLETKRGKLQHINNAFVNRNSDEVKTAIENIIPEILNDCPKISNIVVGYPKGGFESFSANDGFIRTRQKIKSQQEQKKYVEQGKAQRQQENDNSYINDNPLKDRGFFASAQVYQGKNYKVFLGWHEPNPRAVNKRKIIFVHNLGENELIYKEPINITEFQEVYDSLNLTGVEWERIYHYVEGYHHPLDDRRAVMAPYKEETPMVVFGVKGRSPLHQARPRITSITVFESHTGAVKATSSDIVEAVNSVAAAKEKFANSPKVEKKYSLKNGPSDEYLEQERLAREKAISEGYVYKNAHYWSDFKNEDLGQIFSGVRSGLHIKSPILVAYIRNYIENKSALCPQNLDTNHAIFTMSEKTTVRDGYGNIRNQWTKDRGQVRVDRRFIPIFSLYSGITPDNVSTGEAKKLVAGFLGLHGEVGRNFLFEHLKFTYELLTSTSEDIRRIFEKENCSSPVLAQLEENLYRYAMNMKPIQQSSHRIKGAVNVTDEIPSIKTRTLAQACLSLNDYGSRHLRYCNCLEKKIMDLTTQDQVEDFSQNYNKFRTYLDEIEQAIGYGQKHPYSKFYYAEQSCKG